MTLAFASLLRKLSDFSSLNQDENAIEKDKTITQGKK
jgi:hypothetical protein